MKKIRLGGEASLKVASQALRERLVIGKACGYFVTITCVPKNNDLPLLKTEYDIPLLEHVDTLKSYIQRTTLLYMQLPLKAAF